MRDGNLRRERGSPPMAQVRWGDKPVMIPVEVDCRGQEICWQKRRPDADKNNNLIGGREIFLIELSPEKKVRSSRAAKGTGGGQIVSDQGRSH